MTDLLQCALHLATLKCGEDNLALSICRWRVHEVGLVVRTRPELNFTALSLCNSSALDLDLWPFKVQHNERQLWY